MKKHGFIWWLFIGWWWVPITWPFRFPVIAYRIIKRIVTGRRKNAFVLQGQEQHRLQDNQETHKVAGVGFRQDALKALGKKNPDFKKTKQQLQSEGLTDKQIYEYEFSPQQVELQPEPENPEDPNAIKVVVDGQHIGYIKAGSCAHVHKLLKEDKIQRITCLIGGGKSKTLALDEDGERYVLESDTIPFYARLTITKKTEK